IHLRDGACRIMNSDEIAPNDYCDPPDFANNKALRKVLLECSQTGATFDVYFSHAGEAEEVEADDEYLEVEVDQDAGFGSVEVLPAAAKGNGSEDIDRQDNDLQDSEQQQPSL